MKKRLLNGPTIEFLTTDMGDYMIRSRFSEITFTFAKLKAWSQAIVHPVWLVYPIFRLKCCLTEVLEQLGGGISALNVNAIRKRQ